MQSVRHPSRRRNPYVDLFFLLDFFDSARQREISADPKLQTTDAVVGPTRMVVKCEGVDAAEPV